MTTKKNIFIGAAWPYANYSLHLGHVAALLPADILARYYRLKGDNVLFVSGSDCHGTPITVEAEKQKIEPKIIAQKYDKEFRRDLIKRLGFSYDLYSKTTSSGHAKIVQEIFLHLLQKKLIYKKIQELPFCIKCKKFLPDRYIEGTCPKCNFENARGDQCDNCGALLDARELINPICKVCKQKPEWRKSEHFFLKLSKFERKLTSWIKPQKHWRNNAYNFSLNLLKSGLQDRAITRDINWGIKIPVKNFENKRIYVWFEAVCGYLSASKEFTKQWQNFWQKPAMHYYIHGKDNIIFHSIIWPAILLGLGKLNLPDYIVSSEYLNFKGKQFSKSRNWAVWLPDFLDKYNPDSLRYYLTINGPENADTNFTWKNFYLKNNSELVGNYGNFVHRVLNFKCSFKPTDQKIINKQTFAKIGKLIEQTECKKALKSIFNLIKKSNQFIDQQAPWKNPETAPETLGACLEIILNLQILLSVFLPFSSEQLRKTLNLPKAKWQFQKLPKNLKITKPELLFEKI